MTLSGHFTLNSCFRAGILEIYRVASGGLASLTLVVNAGEL